MDVTRHDLHAGWRFACAAADVHSPKACEGLTYYPAKVPGVNLTDLQAAGLVEPDTSATYEDSFAPYALRDFVYLTEFAAADVAQKKHVFLCCDGLDTVCDVWLNGEQVGSGENAHLGYEFDVTGRLRIGANTLLIIFHSPLIAGRRRRERLDPGFPRSHLDLPFPFIRKPAYSFFWDWGPQIAVSGIFRPIYLKGYDEGMLEDVHVRYSIEGRNVTGTVAASARGLDRGTISVRLAGQRFTAPLIDGKALVPFAIDDARLWYPNGEGEQALYDLETTLSGDGGALDVRRQRIGFRSIELLRDARPDGQGQRFVFRVNGKEIFCHGYNWIPVDNAVPRGYGRVYKGNLDLARAGRCNMLRVWGGGYYEDDEFYSLCDERGILVWQDGAFACSLYPDTDPGFMASVEAELKYNIKRLRNCTSLALWCGENENHWGYDDWWRGEDHFPHFYGSNIYDKLFPTLVKELDPDRCYWNGSPYSEQPGVRANDELQGDTHYWDLHGNCGDLSGYLSSAPSFVSETGIQSLPDLRTALTIGGPDDRHMQSFVFDTRNHFESPAKNDRLLKFTAALFRVASSFDESVVVSNLAHAEYMKVAIEHWRSQANQCSGVLIWQLNDCWPAISWAAVDYNLQPKACFYYMQRAFAPDIVGFMQHSAIDYGAAANARGDLFVSSERDGVRAGTVTLDVLTVAGQPVDRQVYPVRLQGRGAVALGEIDLPDYKMHRFNCLAVFTLALDDGTTARNAYTFSRPKHMELPKPRVTVEQVSDTRLRVHSDIFAKGVYLFHPDMAVVFSDNYIDLLPGEERLIETTGAASAGDVRIICYHH